jgi:hypothetical protein
MTTKSSTLVTHAIDALRALSPEIGRYEKLSEQIALDRGYGRPRQAVEVSAPAGDPLQELFDEIDTLNRKRIYKQVPHEPAEAGPKAAPA